MKVHIFAACVISAVPSCSASRKLSQNGGFRDHPMIESLPSSKISLSSSITQSTIGNERKRSLSDTLTFVWNANTSSGISPVLASLTLPPTNSPTKRPTTRPTRYPTAEPTKNPTNHPTSKPTRPPTSPPTSKPTTSPTSTPTEVPSSPPTVSHSFLPTSTPTEIPSSSPTISHSFLPTSSPTNVPSSSPTISPTELPTIDPTFHPTLTPTVSPTDTQSPSASPTATPSVSPTSIPTSSPSAHPTAVPSASPSATPTSSPTLSLQELMATSTIMDFDDCEFMGRDTIELWESVTSYHIYEDLVSRNTSLFQLYINVTMREQEEERLDAEQSHHRRQLLRPSSSSDDERRRLQDKRPLRIGFSVYMSFRSTRYDHDIRKYVGGAFNSPRARLRYVSRLQETHDKTFNTISRVSIIIGGVMPKDEPDVHSRSGTFFGVPPFEMAVGITFVLAAVSTGFVVGYWIVSNRKSRRAKGGGAGGAGLGGVGKSISRLYEENHSPTFIEVDDQCEVSTIGDPMSSRTLFTAIPIPKQQQQILPKEETCDESVISDNYAFSLAGAANAGCGSVASTSTDINTVSQMSRNSSNGNVTNSINYPADDTSFERQFQSREEYIEVVVPPGKLGVVIDTPNDGAPVVHAVKVDSVLATKVMQGDQLVSVDGEDSRGMTALEVSEILAKKSRNRERVLVFVRVRA
eukprot:CAMPEP_0172522062 /NCGR_PEP_ID=MMETSP1066-20121228/292919_1 /TAXON_ID=671091 /ORGANISM="Coscinodiscus wailesii, Strain CCMP2513" /LENGTH=690 /DNA_ID=CAMNT_0013305031 /DNA_START=28 /DNA_END=2100 /DNA_ORIENTATION=+